jgi:hypothetical protein
MPRQHSLTDIHIDSTTACLTTALMVLKSLNDGLGPPFVLSIANIVHALITSVQVRLLKYSFLQLIGCHRM